MKRVRRKTWQFPLFVIFTLLFIVFAVAWHAQHAEAQTIVGWEPMSNGMMAVSWSANDSGEVDVVTFHTIRRQGALLLPMGTISKQAQEDHVWVFWINLGHEQYGYEVDQSPLLPKGASLPPWFPVSLNERDSH